VLVVRWYLRYGLSYRDVEELLAERGVTVDHVSIYRWVQRFTPLLIDAARRCRHASGDRWLSTKHMSRSPGDGSICTGRSISSASSSTCWFQEAGLGGHSPVLHSCPPARPPADRGSTDRAPAYPRAIEELLPTACHVTEQYAGNLVESVAVEHLYRAKTRCRFLTRCFGWLGCSLVLVDHSAEDSLPPDGGVKRDHDAGLVAGRVLVEPGSTASVLSSLT
jgi:hypothetical protein